MDRKPVKEKTEEQQKEKEKAPMGLKSVSVALDELNKNLSEQVKLEETRYKEISSNMQQLKARVETLTKQITDINKRLHDIENN